MRPSLIKANNAVNFLQGNLLTLKRQGPVTPKPYRMVDNITATYQGNQIASLRDDAPSVLLESSLDMASGSWSGSDFAYDRNGNQTRDMSRGVADIDYNALNLPRRIEMASGGTIEYLYTAAGTNLAEIVCDSDGTQTKRRDYAGFFEFEDSETIKNISLASGYITPADTTYHLYIPDHQGNIVAVYNTRTTLREQYTSFYPYGLPQAQISTSSSLLRPLSSGSGGQNSTLGLSPGSSIIITPDPTLPDFTSTPCTNRRLFSAKELTTDHGLNAYDFEARILSPAFPRFTTPDPLSERNNHISLYSFCSGDPVNRIDPTGLADFVYDGVIIGNDGIDDGRVYVVRTTGIGDLNDSGANENTISQEDEVKTLNFIKDAQEKNAKADFSSNQWVYDNCIEIEGSKDTRKKMIDAIKDDGGGGIVDDNNREYGGHIKKNNVEPAEPGGVIDPSKSGSASIFITNDTDVSKFHSHPSGSKEKGDLTYLYAQAPSKEDINNSGNATCYVFGMRKQSPNGSTTEKKSYVYIYNSKGIQAIIPLEKFVNLK